MLKEVKNLETTVKIKKVKENAIIPKNATVGSAGLDLCACIDKNIEIEPGEILKVPTGIALQLCDNNYVAMVFARSGLGINHGISLANGVGVIDSDYRGEIFVGLINLGNRTYTIEPNQRIAQIVIMNIPECKIIESLNLDDTSRGTSGFGSTGKWIYS